MMGSWLLAVSGVLMLVATPPETPDGYKVIVNPSNPTQSLSRSQLSRMFLAASTWDDGQPVLPVDLNPASPLRELFSNAVHGIPAAAVVARWASAPAGGGKIPVTLSSDADVIQYVRLKLGAIGYVSAAADVSAVKVVTIDWTASSGTAAAAPEQLIQAVLTKYATAIERSDLVALKRLWPTINGPQMLAHRAEFGQARTLRVELLDPKIDVKGQAAVVVARRLRVLMTTSGTTMRVMASTTLRLRHDPIGWVIEDIRYQAER